jgi:RHS repeat-associated protein
MRRQRKFRPLICSVLFGLSALAALLGGIPLGRSAPQACTFGIAPTAHTFQAGGGSGGVAVTASQTSCNWTAVSNAAWLNITAGASGVGSGLVNFTVAANPAATPRTSTLTVAGQTFTVNQDGGLLGLQFYPLPAPVRLLDTRPGASPNACSQPNEPIAGNTVRTQPARNFCGLPINAQAITGNVTTVQSGGGYLTLYPSGALQPTIASTNFTANEIINNVFTVGLGAVDGAFNIYALTTTDVVVDVTGYYAPPTTNGLYFHPLPAPVRLLETRAGQPVGCVLSSAPLMGGTDSLQTATGTCTGIPAAARAIVGNATTVGPQTGGYLTLFPADAQRPLVASSNYDTNQIVNGPFAVGLSPAGQFKIFTIATTDLVVDVLGYFSTEAMDANGAGLLFTPLAHPVRLLETRGTPANLPGCFKPNAPLNGGQTYTQPARGLCDGLTIPATALGVVGNATVVFPAGNGYLTVWPSNATQPLIATSNYNAGQIFNRHFITGLGNADGAFKLFSQFTTDLVVDLSGYFTPLPANQPPLASAGADQTSGQNATALLAGQVTDDGLPLSGSLTANWSKLSGPGTVTFGNANQAATTATFSTAGGYVLRLTVNDGALTATDDIQITVNGPLMVNAGADQVITLPNTAMLLGNVTGGAGTLIINWTKQSGPGSVIFSNASNTATEAIFALNGVYVLRLSATDASSTMTDDVQVTVNTDPTPPPVLTAPPLNMTVATTLGDATEFLYTGANPVQTGVAPGTINKVRVAVLKGRVLDKNNQPLPLVKVTVLDHPELGQTLSRADGRFDLVVNGGGVLTVKYEKVGFLPLQRTETVPWQDYCGVPDVVLLGYDPNVTLIDLLSSTAVQTAESGVSTDTSGARRTRLLFKQGTTATMKLPGGAMVGLDKLHVRATEFTVGSNGPNAMPGELPANSAYTYAVEYSIDEAAAANAVETTFSQPVVQYNENFLNFPVGIDIPSGAYDRTTGQWVASASGRVVKILSIAAGTANLDVNGNGVLATDPEYAALGINVAERQKLATLYAVNQTLWRVPIIHFSPWDSNWPYGPPPDAEPPDDDPPDCDTCVDDEDECEGCIIGAQGQTLGEELPVTGTPFKLRYSSDRKPGRLAGRSLSIPLSGAALPASLKRIQLSVTVAGRAFTQSFPAQINQNSVFTWDGLDVYGRTMQGKQLATVNIGYVYDGNYQRSERFGYNGNGIPITGDFTRQEITLSRIARREIGAFDDHALALGGWMLDLHHFYDPLEHTLYEGNGARRTVQTVNATITTVAGNGAGSFSGDNSQATNATMLFPQGVAVAANGELYIADTGNNRIRKVGLNGIITTVVGNGADCEPSTAACGDGGPATAAQLSSPVNVAFGPDGSLFIADPEAQRIRKVAPNGIITTVAGNGIMCSNGTDPCGDGGLATQAQLSFSQYVAVAPDGTLYISDTSSARVRRVGTDGIISTLAGIGNNPARPSGPARPTCTDNVPATQACLNSPFGIVAQPDGAVVFTDVSNHQIYRVSADGIIHVIAGVGGCGTAGDGGPALAAQLCNPEGLTRTAEGSLIFCDWSSGRVRQISPNGIINTIAGTGVLGFSGDGGPARAAQLRQSIGVTTGADGGVYIADGNNHRIRKVFPPLPGFSNADLALPSQDGNELFKFNSAGRHLQTLNTLTGAVKYNFGYDGMGRLVTVTDGDNNVTTIQRNGAGAPTGILSPYNQLTTFTSDANGYLATITNPNNEQNQFTYTSGGLLTLKRDPRNNQNTFTYDALGRFIRDDDAVSGFQTLARSETGQSYSVMRNTALNRTTTFQVQQLSNGDQQRTVTLPNGLQEVLLERQNGTTMRTAPDGTTTNQSSGPDPRWRMQAPLTTASNIATPGGLNFVTSFARLVNLSNPTDPLSLLAQNDTLTINGRSYSNNYNAATKTFNLVTPLNRTTTTVIDAQGRTTQEQIHNFNAALYGYDARGRLATATFGSGPEARSFNYTYNAGGFISSLTDSLNRVFGFAYDNAGRVVQETLPDGRMVMFGYDGNGNQTTVTPPGRSAHTFTFNAVDLLTSYTPPTVPGTSATQYAYNLDRQMTLLTHPGGLTISFGYDTAGRLSSETLAQGTYNFTYHPTTGNIAGISAPGGQSLALTYDGALPLTETWSGVVSGSVSRSYNSFFLPVTQQVNGANPINFTYDNDNLLTSAGALTITRNAQNGLITGTTLGSVTDTRSYNGFGDLINYSAAFNATPLYAVTFTRDKLGRLTQKVETIGGSPATYDYTYDLAGRLQEVKLNTVTLSSYSYDSNSNRLTRTTSGGPLSGTYDAQDRMTTYGAVTYSYTAHGTLSSKTVGAQTTNYNYDALGNLRQVTLPDATQIEYVIDGMNRRVGKKVNGTLTQGWLYQAQREPVAELDGSNNVVSRFVYGTRGQTPDYMIKGGVTYRFITDHLGSVRLMVNSATGAIVQRLDYDEFGVVTFDTNPGFQPFGFAGGLYDTQTKLVRFGVRDYDAESGRWTAKDLLLFAGQQSNLYLYVEGDPLNATDPTGFQRMTLDARELGRREQTWRDGNYSNNGTTIVNRPPSGPLHYNPGTGQYTLTKRKPRTERRYIGCDQNRRPIYRYTEFIDTITTTYTPVRSPNGSVVYQVATNTTTAATGRTWQGY